VREVSYWNSISAIELFDCRQQAVDGSYAPSNSETPNQNSLVEYSTLDLRLND